jgi:hypothetical protein
VFSLVLGGIFVLLGSVAFDSVGFIGFIGFIDFTAFFTLEAGFFLDAKNLFMTSPAFLLRDLATRVRTKSSLRILDHPGSAIFLAITPKSVMVSDLSSFEVAIAIYFYCFVYVFQMLM